ncbi:MAG TPA: proton-conducting transporter membrane subunit, partial [Planctomycetota bacterium]|nr:proton-conducting transporter membrane subunit [Planctomycetota bacterium]
MSSALQWFPIHDRGMLERTLILIPLFPFIGFLLNGLFGSRMEKRVAGWIGVLAAFASFVWAALCVGAVNAPYITAADSRNALHAVYGTWIPTPEFTCSFGLYLDQLSSLMVLIVTGIGTLIHVYSLGYMSHDKSMARFFAYLNLFLFSMLILVLGDNLIMTFVGWEGVGLCSYLLIGFWYEESANASAGMKAFVVNRIGDLGFLLGIFTLIAVFGTVNFAAKPERVSKVDSVTKLKWSDEGRLVATNETLPRHTITHKTHVTKIKDAQGEERTFYELPKNPGLLDYGEAIRLLSDKQPEKLNKLVDYKDPGYSNMDLSQQMGGKVFEGWTLTSVLTIACVLLFVGAMGKSAQIPLYVWLPDAMAGPTPVSALIHAATMVTSGIYMVCRLHGLFACSEDAMRIVAVIGGCTALLAALIGLTQLDIKKVLAYSTVSQLGYMFLGLGIGMFSLGIFHVMTHAFFKALLFLGAGSVIHALHGEQDLRKMGGLRKYAPTTFLTLLVASLAIS